METLVVVSKVKAKVKADAQMNTSAEVADELTKHVGFVLGLAIKSAKSDGRKTVMARDIQGALNTYRVDSEAEI